MRALENGKPRISIVGADTNDGRAHLKDVVIDFTARGLYVGGEIAESGERFALTLEIDE